MTGKPGYKLVEGEESLFHAMKLPGVDALL